MQPGVIVIERRQIWEPVHFDGDLLDHLARFTDVGCTYRPLWRETYQAIRPLLEGVGPELSPEMIFAALRARKRIIEVPVSFHRRIGGESKHSANYFRISRTALCMLRTIFKHFFAASHL